SNQAKIRLCPNNQTQKTNKTALRIRQKSLAAYIHIQTCASHITNYADDSHPRCARCRITKLIPLPNRVLARPEPSRERIINNGDLLGLQTILFCELTSAKQRNPHCSEIARRHQIYRGFDLFSSRKRRLSFYREIR